MSSFLLFLGILVLLIVVHELGHFLFAKLFGVKVEEFGVGYPPRIAKLFQIGETSYTINWIPFGGFVRILGEAPDEKIPEEEKHKALSGKHPLIQLSVLFGGVLFNFIFAWFAFSLAFSLGVLRPVENVDTTTTQQSRIIISGVLDNSPAHEADVPTGVQIVSLSHKNQTITPKTTEEVSDFVSKYEGKPITLKVQEIFSTSTQTFKLTTAHGILTDNPDKAGIGIVMSYATSEPLPASEALKEGLKTTYEYSVMIIHTIKEIVSSALNGKKSDVLTQISGPVGIVGIIGDASSVGLATLVQIMAIISVNLAVLNLLPIPALDGGRIVLLLIEWITRRKIPTTIMQALNAISFFALIALMVYVTYNDIIKLFS